MNGDEAMTAYSRGDAHAFAEVYDAVAPKLERFLRPRVKDRALVEDLVQQTFLQMHQARGSFIPGAPVLPWALTIARHLLCDAKRKGKREESRELDEEADAPPTHVQAPEGHAWTEAKELGQRMEVAYQALTPPQRQAWDLRAMGFSVAQSARTLNTSAMGIKLRVRRALLVLRAAASHDRP